MFSLCNISLGAEARVPFIGDSLDFTFNFCTREHPFRLTVWVFGGGGFFGITVTPDRCRMLEASFEFGAACAIDFGVASGSIECMAGIYFRLETSTDGKDDGELTGYFRLRGEVDVLGLISASLELYLELSYEPPSGKATGRATLTIEVEVCFLSFSVDITCEKKFTGSNNDPTFAEVMGHVPIGGRRRGTSTATRSPRWGTDMATESVIWTLLPDGIDPATDRLRSTIFVTPAPADRRLTATRSTASRRSSTGPTALALLKFEAEIDGIGTVTLDLDERVAAPDPATWDLLFGDRVFVDRAGGARPR